jgi:hypothetical protein
MRIGCVVLTGVLLTIVVGCEVSDPFPKRQASGTVGGVGLEGAGVTPDPPKPAYQPPGADLINQPLEAPNGHPAGVAQPGGGAAPQAASSVGAQPPAVPAGPAAQPGTTPQPGATAPPSTAPQPSGGNPGPSPQPGKTVQPAAPGVTGKGNYQPGLITTPVRIYFRVQERLIFEVQIPHAMQLFEAENGYKPRTHEEFMEKIIKANNLQLPDLPPDHRYVYDPEQGELMVEHPG